MVITIVFLIIIVHRLNITRKQKNIIEIQKEKVQDQNEEIEASFNYARRIQEAILPPESLINKQLPDNLVIYLPKYIVAGDFYWMEEEGDEVYFACADCTGHGVPGAMVSVVCANALTRAVSEMDTLRNLQRY